MLAIYADTFNIAARSDALPVRETSTRQRFRDYAAIRWITKATTTSIYR
ncbi:hypothetical protein [Pelagovum pacificum]|nr:hypothetical protein [Pelagovum pacificum]QQA42751.1 hypothetical protein I8N54_18580 [Pelagovum pacificum]